MKPDRSRNSVSPGKLLLLIALPLTVYLNTLQNGFVYDDHVQVTANRAIRSLSNVGAFFHTDVARAASVRDPGRVRYWRPLFLTSYAIDYRIWGLNPFGYHLTNLALHVAVTLLVVAFAIRTGAGAAEALLAALLFAVHPANSEAVNWVGARVELLCAVFVLPAFWCYEKWRSRAGGGPWLAVAAALCVCSLLSWEAAIAVPLLLAGREALGPAAARPRRQTVLAVAGCIAVTALYVGVRATVVGWPAMLPVAGGLGGALPLWCMTVFDYARLLVCPAALSAAYPIPSPASMADPKALAGAALVATGVAGAAVRMARRRGRVSGVSAGTSAAAAPAGSLPSLFWLWWIVAALMPAFNIGGFGGQRLAERYLYIASVGYCVLLARGFLWLQRRAAATPLRLAPVGAAALVLIVFAVATGRRNRVWHDDAALYAQTVADVPDSALMRNNLGSTLEQLGRDREAAVQLREAIAINPRYVDAHLNLALVYRKIGDWTAALNELAVATALAPTAAEPHFQKGELLRDRGDLAAAKEEWTAAVRLDPSHSGAHNNLGNLCRIAADLRCARDHYRAAAAADPDNAAALFNLAATAEGMGASEEAIASYERFLAVGASSYPNEAAAAVDSLRRLRAPPAR